MWSRLQDAWSSACRLMLYIRYYNYECLAPSKILFTKKVLHVHACFVFFLTLHFWHYSHVDSCVTRALHNFIRTSSKSKRALIHSLKPLFSAFQLPAWIRTHRWTDNVKPNSGTAKHGQPTWKNKHYILRGI